MGLLWSLLGYPRQEKTDIPDPVTGLTSRDKYLVTSTWATVRKTPTESGVGLLSLFFKNSPEHQQLFPFKDVPWKDLPTNKRFQAHANAVVNGFSSIVDAVDNTDLLIEILTKLSESHVPRNVTEKGFLDLKNSLIELFSTFTKPEEIEAWKKTLDVVFNVIIDKLKKIEKS